MESLKYLLTWVSGVIVAVFALSWWQNEEIDLGYMISMSLASLVGVLLVSGIRKALKKR